MYRRLKNKRLGLHLFFSLYEANDNIFACGFLGVCHVVSTDRAENTEENTLETKKHTHKLVILRNGNYKL